MASHTLSNFLQSSPDIYLRIGDAVFFMKEAGAIGLNEILVDLVRNKSAGSLFGVEVLLGNVSENVF